MVIAVEREGLKVEGLEVGGAWGGLKGGLSVE